jgi:hypothetical protein
MMDKNSRREWSKAGMGKSQFHFNSTIQIAASRRSLSALLAKKI